MCAAAAAGIATLSRRIRDAARPGGFYEPLFIGATRPRARKRRAFADIPLIMLPVLFRARAPAGPPALLRTRSGFYGTPNLRFMSRRRISFFFNIGQRMWLISLFDSADLLSVKYYDWNRFLIEV